MKKIHIFKTGTHRDSGGTVLDFSEDTLSAAASAYDPKTHEAPIVIGHPKSNGPAYGWIKSLEFNAGDINAIPHQLNADFEEMVKNGAFKKVSASWYLPDSPANPSPGNLYLRHVGFLGAQPPAIKGLQQLEFNEADEGVIEFEDSIQDAFNLQGISGVFKRMREFLIDKFSREEADRVIPDFIVDDLNRSADLKLQNDSAIPNFNEGDNMTLEELQAQVDTLQAENEQLKTDNGELKSKVASFEEQQAAAIKTAIESKVDNLIKEGRALPADREYLIDFAEQAEQAGRVLEFGEGEDKQTLTGADAFLHVACKEKKVDFSERSADDGERQQPLSAADLSRKAVEYQEQQRAEGNTIDIATAVNHIQQQQASE